MNARFVIAIIVIAGSVSFLISRAAEESARAVVTVQELVSSGEVRERIRLGARVAEGEVKYQTQPQLLLQFAVTDIENSSAVIPVQYSGVRPDTFQVGRDVILEGNFDGKSFEAQSLLTQCPSKYKPPTPEAGGANH